MIYYWIESKKTTDGEWVPIPPLGAKLCDSVIEKLTQDEAQKLINQLVNSSPGEFRLIEVNDQFDYGKEIYHDRRIDQ